MILRLVGVLPEEEEGVFGKVIGDAIVVGCLLVSGECGDSASTQERVVRVMVMTVISDLRERERVVRVWGRGALKKCHERVTPVAIERTAFIGGRGQTTAV